MHLPVACVPTLDNMRNNNALFFECMIEWCCERTRPLYRTLIAGGAPPADFNSLIAAVSATAAARHPPPMHLPVYQPPGLPVGYAPVAAPQQPQYPPPYPVPVYRGYPPAAAGQLPGLGASVLPYSQQVYSQPPQYAPPAPMIGSELQALLNTLSGAIGRQPEIASSPAEDPEAALSFEGRDLKVGIDADAEPYPVLFLCAMPCLVRCTLSLKNQNRCAACCAVTAKREDEVCRASVGVSRNWSCPLAMHSAVLHRYSCDLIVWYSVKERERDVPSWRC